MLIKATLIKFEKYPLKQESYLLGRSASIGIGGGLERELESCK